MTGLYAECGVVAFGIALSVATRHQYQRTAVAGESPLSLVYMLFELVQDDCI